jgi:hypothetical protein
MCPHVTRPTTWILAAIILSGCSFSDSSVSISGSIESSSESSTSSSASSGKGGVSKDKLPYRDDVANLTYSIAGSKMTATDFPNALARTASQFKISDWAGEKATFYGIGKGLKRAGIAKDNIGRQPFLANVLNANKDALHLIQEGYKY